ncbi:MAG: hypothetical protein GXX96_10985 [Planctomycetaceae bacterium]|nr:hypothetical protein [Planctomycetaceae bacterium]
MKAVARCPNCHASFNVDRASAGRRTKCPKCEQSFLIQFDEPTPEAEPDPIRNVPHSPPPTPQRVSSVIRAAADSTPPREENRKLRPIAVPLWAMITIPSIACLIIGYFIGREHSKQQMERAVADIGKAFTEGLTSEVPAISPSSGLSSNLETESEKPTPHPRMLIGERHAAKGFSIALTNASIDKSQVKDLMGNVGVGQNPDLVLRFNVVNTDDRRILRFHEGNMFLPGHFRLRDDVDNVIRGVNYGMGSKPVGALTGAEDIAPGASATHIELFSVPLPKTKFLILTVDLACFGDQGEIEFQIPADKIKR